MARFNGQASDYSYEDGVCPDCKAELPTATSYTTTSGCKVEWNCPACGAGGEEYLDYL